MKAAPDSLNVRLRTFFVVNPHELLTFGDIAKKFDATPATVKTTVQTLRKQGLLRTDRVVMGMK